MGDKSQDYTIISVTKMVSLISGIQVNVLRSKARPKPVTCARYICFHFIRKLVKWQGNKGVIPYKVIGKYFNRDHSTVLTGKEALSNMLFTREEIYVKLMKAVENKIAEQQHKT